MPDFCTCDDWREISQHHPSIFKWDEDYGWLISWIDLGISKGRVVRSDYGIKIKFCPFCGRELNREATDAR